MTLALLMTATTAMDEPFIGSLRRRLLVVCEQMPTTLAMDCDGWCRMDIWTTYGRWMLCAEHS